MTTIESLLSEAKNYSLHDWFPIPIGVEKQPPKGCTWTDKRGTSASKEYLEEYFNNNHGVKRLAILLESSKLGFALDLDGLTAQDIFRRKVLSKCSPGLQDKINQTTHTRTANGGYHWLFEILRRDFPKGIAQRTYWTSKQNDHGEIKVIGSNQYLIERGKDYEPVRGIESLVTFTKEEADEFLDVLDKFNKETMTIKNVGNMMVQYYCQSNRQNLALRVAGYLFRNRIPEYLTHDLIEYLIDRTGDDESNKRFQAVRDTYTKDANSNQVSGRTKLLEVFNGDEFVITLINQELIRLGYFFNGSGNSNNGKSKTDSKNKRSDKPEYSVFKYSSRFRGPLHEAILLNGEPVFLTYENGQLQTVKRIEEVNRILRPPSIEEYPYEPYEFNSIGEIMAYGEKARTETVDTLYQTMKSVVKLYIDQDEESTILMSADILWTYFQDLFPTTHYYDVTGRANGIGKSTIGHVFEGIAYRAVNLTDPSAANLYRILGPIEAGQCIIIADEADKIHNSSELLSILKTGYTQLGRVSKVNMNTLKQEFFYSYCFKIRIGEESLRTSVAAGVVDRSFQFKPVKGKPLYDIKEVLQPAIRNASLGKLQNDLRSLRKLLLVYRLVHFNDLIAVDIDIGLEGRDKELCKPLLQLFHETKAYPKVKSSLESFLNKKNKRKKNTVIDSVLYEIIVNLVSSKGDKIYNAEIWQAIRDKIPGHWDDKKPGVYETYDYDTIYRTTIIKIVESFGAEHDRDHVGRFLKFDLALLAKAARQFDIDISIQDKLDNILAANKTSNVFNFDYLDVTSSQPKNDVNITGNEEANKEIAKKLAENNNNFPLLLHLVFCDIFSCEIKKMFQENPSRKSKNNDREVKWGRVWQLP